MSTIAYSNSEVDRRPDVSIGASRKISQNVRVALDAVRGAAAIYVVLHHVILGISIPRPVEVALSFGQEAVILFFLLSGFVIYANEIHRLDTVRGYYLRRIRRIYPTLICALIISAVVASVMGTLEKRFDLGELAATLFGLQDISFLKPGVISDPFLGNDPLWSLSYEMFFYLVFPAVAWVQKRSSAITSHFIGACCVASYGIYLLHPNHFALIGSYFLVWWIGAAAAKAYLAGKFGINAMSRELGWLAVLILTATVGVIVNERSTVGIFPFLPLRHFGFAMVVMLIATLPIWAGLAPRLSGYKKPLAFLASISYGLYVIHYPMLVQTNAVEGIQFLPLVVFTFLLAYVIDFGLMKVIPRAPKN